MTHIVHVGPALVLMAVIVGACGPSKDQRQAGAESGAADSGVAASAAPTKLRVSNVMIGKGVGPTAHITEPTFQFAPQETVHVSVATVGSGGGTLTAAWRSPGGEVLEQSTEPVPAAGENTAFHLSRPAGLKPGTYKMIVFLNDDSVDTKVFVIKK